MSKSETKTEPKKPMDPAKKRELLLFWIPLCVAWLFLLLSVLVNLDFVKDDAYITWHYAQNLLLGNGLTFNVGERVEGSTTFLWIFVALPFEALGLDLFQVFEILGTLMIGALLWLMAMIHRRAYGLESGLGHIYAAIWMSCSSTATLWATSGMEGPLGTLLPTLSFFLTFEALRTGSKKFALWGGIVVGLGCITRPEVHLIGAVFAVPVIYRSIKAKKLDPITWLYLGGLLAITAPVHLFRYIYFGGLFPNPMYVKTSGSFLIVETGLRTLYDMLAFNGIGALVMLAPLAFMDKKRLVEKSVMAVICAAYMVYIVKVGADEMRWHRLYLPALPFLAMLGGFGLRNLWAALRTALPKKRWATIAAAVVGVGLSLGGAGASFGYSYTSMAGFNGRGDLAGNYHPDMGKFIVRHERRGGLVAFQDMGSTPYHSQDLSYLDFIGLTDYTIARARSRYGLHAFAATEADRDKPAWQAEMREYFYERNPEWAILTTYVPGTVAARVAESYATDPTPRTLEPYIAHNPHQFGIYNARFKREYVHVRTWPRSSVYYLSLFRRRDLWDQVPREVVFEEPPDDLHGITATFGDGLEMIGSDMETETIQRHEFFCTTWWRAPGPRPADTHFFIHMESTDARIAYDHIPGDWMYPADRWREGDIIENRILVQVPPGYPAGEYRVYLGIYNPSTGERWPVTNNSDISDNRVLLGTVSVATLLPLVHSTIPRTDLDEMRAHPDRITDHGRQPGE
ncbi:MAG: hypothetical protein DRJ42_00230 [Deltaproteobacteria bacterium]|nr:MAG: hypothetical protein DRJ42_00230 [Deltaproteobacteria bacterium]